jgi:DNA-binding HxlR family transcriptional regulator
MVISGAEWGVRSAICFSTELQTLTIENAVPKSTCAINLSLELFGDRWTLLILRDMMFQNRRHFGELLASEERIASNVLSDRLKMLVAEGFLTRREDPTHKLKAIYSLTEKAIALLPVIAQIGLWGRAYHPDSPRVGPHIWDMMEGGPKAWARFMADLRAIHLGEGGAQTKRRRTTAARRTVVAA